MNCATTILLNPVAFAPSARTPFIPNTERNDTLKIYGDAPVTVSVSIVRVWFVVGAGVAIKLVGTDGRRYVN